MKILVVLGSVREGSVSKKVAQSLIDGAKSKGAEVVVYDAYNMNVKGCMGCGSCRKNGTDCVIQDDMQAYYKDLHTCEALVLTAPNYYSQVAGHMITFMNRHYCMNNADRTSRLKQGIKLVGIFSQGAPQDYPKYLPNYEWYLNTFISKGMDLIANINVGGNSDLNQVCQKAYHIGETL